MKEYYNEANCGGPLHPANHHYGYWWNGEKWIPNDANCIIIAPWDSYEDFLDYKKKHPENL